VNRRVSCKNFDCKPENEGERQIEGMKQARTRRKERRLTDTVVTTQIFGQKNHKRVNDKGFVAAANEINI
jgi:hypothetical protein